jgi:hypothetical protein
LGASETKKKRKSQQHTLRYTFYLHSGAGNRPAIPEYHTRAGISYVLMLAHRNPNNNIFRLSYYAKLKLYHEIDLEVANFCESLKEITCADVSTPHSWTFCLNSKSTKNVAFYTYIDSHVV